MSGPTSGPPADTRQESAPELSWRDRLAAKQRRRIIVPVQISQEGGALAARVAHLRGLNDLVRDMPSGPEQLRGMYAGDLAAAEAELAEHTVDITFQSLPPDQWDALGALHPSTDPADDGGIAWRTALPALAAACCAEDGGDDEDWWTTILAMPSWTTADLLTLWGALLRLHTRAPSARIPFA